MPGKATEGSLSGKTLTPSSISPTAHLRPVRPGCPSGVCDVDGPGNAPGYATFPRAGAAATRGRAVTATGRARSE